MRAPRHRRDLPLHRGLPWGVRRQRQGDAGPGEAPARDESQIRDAHVLLQAIPWVAHHRRCRPQRLQVARHARGVGGVRLCRLSRPVGQRREVRDDRTLQILQPLRLGAGDMAALAAAEDRALALPARFLPDACGEGGGRAATAVATLVVSESTMDILLTHGYFLYEDPHELAVMKPYPPLGILYISSHLKARGFDAAVFDSTFSSKDAFRQYV